MQPSLSVYSGPALFPASQGLPEWPGMSGPFLPGGLANCSKGRGGLWRGRSNSPVSRTGVEKMSFVQWSSENEPASQVIFFQLFYPASSKQ